MARIPNPAGKTRPLDQPYEVYEGNGWEYRVLKHYQSPVAEAKNPYARVFCAVRSPYTYGDYEYGDTYIADVQQGPHRTFVDPVLAEDIEG